MSQAISSDGVGPVSRDAERRQETALVRRNAATGSDSFVVKTLSISMIVAILTEKIALPLDPGKIALQVTLLIQYATIAVLMYRGRIRLERNKLLLFLLFASLALLVHIVRGESDFGIPSLLFVLAIYANYIFVVPMQEQTYVSFIRVFQMIAVGACGMVLIDWLFQFAHHEMPNLEHFVPKPLLFFNYVYLQPLEWGNHYTKPNGFFFLETSYVSQFIAFALVIELCLFQRFHYIGTLAVGVVLSFGGTGMTLVLLSTPVILAHLRLKLVPLALIGAPLVLVVASQIGLLDNIAKRSQEFSQEGSSGNQRFVVQAQRVGEVLSGNTKDALVGIGAGQMPQRLNMMWTPISKILVEYGFFVYAAFWVFFFYSLFGRGVPFVISWIMVMQYLFLNGSFLVPVNSFLNVMLAGMYAIRKQPGLSAWREPAGWRGKGTRWAAR